MTPVANGFSIKAKILAKTLLTKSYILYINIDYCYYKCVINKNAHIAIIKNNRIIKLPCDDEFHCIITYIEEMSNQLNYNIFINSEKVSIDNIVVL